MMTSQESIKIIKIEVNKIIEYLLSEYKIEIKEIKSAQYGIKYEVKNKLTGITGILVIYYGKKGFKLVNEKIGCQDSHSKVIEIFNNRDNLFKTNLNEKIKIETKRLDKLYEILKSYANEEFDFSDFAKELLKYSSNDEKILIEKNIYNFKELEKIYIKLKKENK